MLDHDVVELADQTLFLVRQRPLELDPKTSQLLEDQAARERLGRLRAALADARTASAWTPPQLEEFLKSFAESEGGGLGKIGPLLRGVLSGGAPAPDLGRTLVALGRDEALGRIDDALSPSA